jgi:hypothetical protein
VRWFRLYDDIIDDPKVLLLSPEWRWNYVALLACANRHKVRGELPNAQELSVHLRVSVNKAQHIIDRFKGLGFVDQSDDGIRLMIHGWHRRQFKSDDITDRTARSKQRQRERSQERCEERHGNVAGNGPDTDTEAETESPPSVLAKAKTSSPKGKKLVDFVLPDWIPADAWADWEESRRATKNPLTPGARTRCVNTLARLRSVGQDPRAVIDQAIERGYRGLFPLDASPKHGAANGQPKPEEPKLTWTAADQARHDETLKLIEAQRAARHAAKSTDTDHRDE